MELFEKDLTRWISKIGHKLPPSELKVLSSDVADIMKAYVGSVGLCATVLVSNMHDSILLLLKDAFYDSVIFVEANKTNIEQYLFVT